MTTIFVIKIEKDFQKKQSNILQAIKKDYKKKLEVIYRII